jgi:DNA polymerase III subunit delta'
VAKTLVWKKLIAQEKIKVMLSNAFANGTIGHAYLFCGEVGTGTFQAAFELSMALLCGSDGEVPCGKCESCEKMLHGAYPDFHVIVPVYLEKEHKGSDGKLNQEGWAFLSSVTQKRIAEPYRAPHHTGIPLIPVEWIKEVNHAIMRGAILKGKNIALIDGVDIMNKESANAMLATLEEPPPDTVLLLATERPQAVLPTIASRCQLLRFGCLPADQMKNALASRFGASISPKSIDEAVDYSSGSLDRAIDFCENSDGVFLEESRALLKECFCGDWEKIAAHVDRLAKDGDREHHEKLLMHLVYLFRNKFLEKIRNAKASTALRTFSQPDTESDFWPESVSSIHPERAALFYKACQTAINGVRAYGNSSIVFVNFIITIMEIFREQKQQIS